MHRGRLIFPVIATIRCLDIAATRAASGYDETFREEALVSSADGLGTPSRINKTDIDVPTQIEEKDWFERLQAMTQGNAPETTLFLTFHLNDLKRLGLWEEDANWGGRPKFVVGDQVMGFKDRYNQQLFKTPDNPGLFFTEVRPTGFLSTQNIIVCVVSDRAQTDRRFER